MDNVRDLSTLIGEHIVVTQEFIDHWNINCDHKCPLVLGDTVTPDVIRGGSGIPNCGIRAEGEIVEGLADYYWINAKLLLLLGYEFVKDDDG